MKLLTLTVSLNDNVITPVLASKLNVSSLGGVSSGINLVTCNACVSGRITTGLFAISLVKLTV